MNNMEPKPCPSCRRLLIPAGRIQVAGASGLVYQCGHCTRPVDLGLGDHVEENLTFWLNEDTGLLSVAPGSFES